MDDEERGDGCAIAIFLTVCALVVAACVIFGWKMMGLWYETPEQRGIFGDMFGALNTLFSGLAFAGVIFAILLQKQELKLQRGELRAQRAEMKQHNAHLERQLLASQFFQLLNSFQEVAHQTRFEDEQGRAALEILAGQLETELAVQREEGSLTKEEIVNVYQAFYARPHVSAALGHYFRMLYHIVKFVHEHPALRSHGDRNIDERYKLVRLVRAHLSEPELRLLFANGLSPHGAHFYPLIDDYDLLQNFSFRGIPEDEQRLYPKTYSRRFPLAGA